MPVLPSIGTRLGPGWGAWLKDVTLHGESAADVLSRQVRFRITEPGSTSIEHVVPDSARARELWELPSTRSLMQGVIDLADRTGTSLPSQLAGLSFAGSEAGFVINRATHGMRSGVQPTMDAFEAAMDAARAHTSGTVAVRKGAWLHIGPVRSAGLLWALDHPGASTSSMAPELRSSLGHGVKTLLHELDHVGTPKSPLTPHLDWLREGRAEAFARWPGRIREAGRMLGLDVTDDIGKQADLDGPYQEEVAAVRTLLGLAGIDAARRSSFPEAQALLSVADETQLASRIAAAVARQHASSPSEDAAIRRMVEHLVNERIAPDGSNADMRVVDRLKELMTESTAP